MTNPKTFEDMLALKRAARMSEFDAAPIEIRNLANEYGWTVVNTFQCVGLTKAKHIRHCIETTLDSLCPTRTPSSHQGPHANNQPKLPLDFSQAAIDAASASFVQALENGKDYPEAFRKALRAALRNR